MNIDVKAEVNNINSSSDMLIRYADIVQESIVDGPGIRLVLFVQGCPLACEGCHNPAIQDSNGGKVVPVSELADKIISMMNPLHRGLTISGGEPTEQAEAVTELLKIIKQDQPKLDIWMYSGYNYDKIKDLLLLDYVDVLVDGPFILKEKSLDLKFRGSRNQRVIDVRASRESGKVEEWKGTMLDAKS